MTEHVMPEPPEGMHWEVDSHRYWMFDYEPRLRVSLMSDDPGWFGRPKRILHLSSSHSWSAYPKRNADKAVELAEQLLIEHRQAKHAVNGLKGATLGKGVSRS